MKKFVVHSIVVMFALVFVSSSWADTFVEGSVSGTWDPSGNPYYVINDCSVPSGQLLTILPGVRVIIGQDLRIVVQGRIEAVGTFDQRIVFEAPNDSTYWKYILVDAAPSQGASRFEYCDLTNAETGIYLKICCKRQGTMTANIKNCRFANCIEQGIYGESLALSDWNASHDTYLNPTIEECIFDNTVRGIIIKADGYSAINQATSKAHAAPVVKNCLFQNLTGEALGFSIVDNVNTCSPVFNNNTVLNCGAGVSILNPFDADIKNNIFYGNPVAVAKTGDQSNDVQFNCFYGNDANFDGYPSSYGSIVMTNRNGDPCDIAFNIFEDPLFLQANNYHLMGSSPCIEGGTSDGAPDIDIDGDSRPCGAGYDIGADEYAIIANFSASPTRGAAPLTVHFSDQSTGTVDLWSWDFGDGSSSTEQNPTHIYNDYGTYTVSLTVTGPCGSDTESKTNYINLVKAMPWIPLLLLDE